MPSLAQHQSLRYVKGLFVGDPGAGKTGALTSLVKAGYDLRIYDFDNLLGTLVNYVQKECPDKIDQVKFQTFTDKMKAPATPVMMNGKALKVMPGTDGIAKAYTNCLSQLERWKTGEEDLGDPSTWGENTVVVVDSLTTASNAAFRYAQSMNPASAEPRTDYFVAQQLITNLITKLCSDQFKVNVLVLAHIHYDKNHLDVTKGFPRSVGAALNEVISAYFNCVLMAESSGSGTNVKRMIRTNSTGIVDLKNPVSFRVPDSLPLSAGLATFFEAVKAQPAAAAA